MRQLKIDNRPPVGLVGISLPGERTDIAQDALARARVSLAELGFEVLGREDLALSEAEVFDAVKDLPAAGAVAIVYLLGTWIEAPMVVNAMGRLAGTPAVIWAIPALPSFSLVASGVIKGALDDLGRSYGFIYGDPDEAETHMHARSCLQACAVVQGLKHAKLGVLGGRSLGMYTSTIDEMGYKGVFGTEMEHVDQLRLVAYAQGMDPAEVARRTTRLRGTYGRFEAPEETLDKSVRLLLALERIVAEEGFAFLGVKCLGEVINHYTSCCLAISILNDNGLPTACQADIPAAFVLKAFADLSGGACGFADVVHVDCRTGLTRLANCGTMPTTLSVDPRSVVWGWQYEYMGKGRGVTPIFTCRGGRITLGCLARAQGRMTLQVATGEAEEHPLADLAEVREIWAQAFVRLDGDPRDFVRSLRSNHIIMAYGDLRPALREACNLWGIGLKEIGA